MSAGSSNPSDGRGAADDAAHRDPTRKEARARGRVRTTARMTGDGERVEIQMVGQLRDVFREVRVRAPR